MPQSIGLSGLLLGGAGLVGMIIGPSMLASGDKGNAVIGGLLLGFGVAFVGGAWVLLHYGRSERQPGATTIVKLR